MQVITLYRQNKMDGTTTVSPEKPNGEYTTLFRLIADEGKGLTKDGSNPAPCIDTHTLDGWSEVDLPPQEEPKPNEQCIINDINYQNIS